MYKWDPEDYEKNSSSQEKWADVLITRIKLNGNEHVLDIGCGGGKVTAKIAAKVPEGSVLGIDSSQDMINFAQKKFPRVKNANMRFKLGDALDLRFNQEFDLVTSFSCLHWIRDHLTVLKGIRRSLRQDGRIFIHCGGKAEIYEVAKDIIEDDRWSRYFQDFEFPFNFYNPEEYHGWLNAAGLKELRVVLVSKEMILQGKPGLEGMIRTVWLPYTSRVPENLRPQFVSEIAERYLEHHPLEAGLAKVKAMRMEIEARRID